MRPHARPWLFTLWGIIFTTALAVTPTGQATAAEVAKDALQADAQTFTVSPNVPIPNVEYASDWAVTTVTVVQWPSSDHDITWGQGNFGIRHCRGCSVDHHGIDFNPGWGTPVEAVADGVVLASGPAGALGWSVTIRHLVDGVTTDTVYGHMIAGSLMVAAGQEIDRGTVLGLVGNTGLSTGPHLHFEVHISGIVIDPWEWLLEHENAEEWAWLESRK